ncbi:MAG: dTMP kinase [Myxococcales bacterium]|nr:MAG: dTMP kinase [Myxococcales bacterium]
MVMEGIDGSGSTTHTKLLGKALRQRGLKVVETCEPSSGPVGSLIRQVLQKRLFVADAGGPRSFAWSTMALLFAADRMDHLDSTIVPALREGAVVLSDRYDLSSIAYQSCTAPNGDKVVPWIRELNAAALRPDLTIVIDVPVEVAEERRRARGGLEEMFETRDLQARLAGVYADAERLIPHDRVAHVMGVGAVSDVASNVLNAVTALDPEFFRGSAPY